MDIVEPGPDLVRVAIFRESVEQLHFGPRRLDRDHVGVERRDCRKYVVEFGIAHVRMDLRFIRDTARGELEGAYCPFEITRPVAPPERQALAERRLVDL